MYLKTYQASHTKLCTSPLHAPMSVALGAWDVRKTDAGLVSMLDVIAHVKRISHRYAGQLYQRMSQAERVPVCEARPLPPSVSDLTDATSPMRRARRGCCRPAYITPVANVDQMTAIIWQLPNTLQFRQECTEHIVQHMRYHGMFAPHVVLSNATQAHVVNTLTCCWRATRKRVHDELDDGRIRI